MALVEADVIGPCPIVDARGDGDKVKGQTVVLDDERTNVEALVGVHISRVRPFEDKRADQPAKATAKGPEKP